MIKATLTKHNTTVGCVWTVVTTTRSKSFKTEKGAKRWAKRNNMIITETSDITKE